MDDTTDATHNLSSNIEHIVESKSIVGICEIDDKGEQEMESLEVTNWTAEKGSWDSEDTSSLK